MDLDEGTSENSALNNELNDEKFRNDNVNLQNTNNPFDLQTETNFRGSSMGAGVVGNGPQGNSNPTEHVSVTLFPSKLERQYSFDMKQAGGNRFFDILRQFIIVALLIAIFFGFLFESKVNYDRKSEHLFRSGMCDKDTHFTSKYAVVFDAGSTGSRVHVYEFQFCGKKLSNLVDEVFEKTKPGLSAYPENPDDAVESLVPLLRKAWRRVPRDLRRCTPIVLKATAGLRLLPAEKVANILDGVKSWLDDQPFHLPRLSSGFASEPVSVIDGSEEAVSAWISVNFLQGHIGLKKPNQVRNGENVTSVVLEMGGGSSQIVFDQNETKSSEYPVGIVDLKFFGRQYQLYQHSFLGYGLMEARKSIKTSFIESKKNHFACYPKGHEETFYDGNIIGNSEGWDTCRKLVQNSLFANNHTCNKLPCSINGVHQPKIPEKSPIYVLSYINDRAHDLGLNGVEGYTLSEIKQKSEKICQGTMKSEPLYEKNPSLCLDLTFIYTLLHDGYGIRDDRKIHSGETINGYETGWTLGSALSVIETAPTFCN